MVIYKTKREAERYRRGEEVVQKVEGGYALMSYGEWRIWKARNRK